MQDTVHHHFTQPLSLPKPTNTNTNTHFPSLCRPRKSPKHAPITLPPSISDSRDPPIPCDEFQEKLLFLDSIGIDFLSVISDHPPIVATSLAALRSTVHLLSSPALGFNSPELRRIVRLCPEVLTSGVADVIKVLTFLLREAGVSGPDRLKKALLRRPRLLACSVETQLRPTLAFLRTTIGVSEADLPRHTYLLTSSIDRNLKPRIAFFVNTIGFSESDSISMFRAFPQLFCFSVKECYEPKLNYFVVEMGRGLRELTQFPDYFSYSLENRIKPRHRACVDKGVFFTLPVLLRTGPGEFRRRLEIRRTDVIQICTSPVGTHRRRLLSSEVALVVVVLVL